MKHYHLHIKFKEKDMVLPAPVSIYEHLENVKYNQIFKDLNGEYEITEHTEFLDGMTISVATIRKGVTAPVAGAAIWNRHDFLDYETGLRTAFKRAVNTYLLDEFLISINEADSLENMVAERIIDKFRSARYNTLKEKSNDKENR